MLNRRKQRLKGRREPQRENAENRKGRTQRTAKEEVVRKQCVKGAKNRKGVNALEQKKTYSALICVASAVFFTALRPPITESPVWLIS